MHRTPQWLSWVRFAQRSLDCVQTRCMSARVLNSSRCAPLIMAIVLSSLLDTAHGADIYRWKDDNNVTTFSQRPPVEGVYVKRLLRRAHNETNEFRATSVFGSWRAVLPPAVSVEQPQGNERSGIRPAETPAEQERRERHEEVSVASPQSPLPRQRRAAQWIEIRPQPGRSPQR